MLHEFLTTNRAELMKRYRAKAVSRSGTVPKGADRAVSIFLAQITEALRDSKVDFIQITSVPDHTPTKTEIGRAGVLHGADLLRRGYRVDEVVHDYGHIFQAITELALEQDRTITLEELRMLHRCMDEAIAGAATAFARGKNDVVTREDRLLLASSPLNYEQHLVRVALQIVLALQTGNLNVNGPTGTALQNTLNELRDLMDQKQRESIGRGEHEGAQANGSKGKP